MDRTILRATHSLRELGEGGGTLVRLTLNSVSTGIAVGSRDARRGGRKSWRFPLRGRRGTALDSFLDQTTLKLVINVESNFTCPLLYQTTLEGGSDFRPCLCPLLTYYPRRSAMLRRSGWIAAANQMPPRRIQPAGKARCVSLRRMCRRTCPPVLTRLR